MRTIKYDVAVIGGGIIGLATAMTLARKHPGHRFVVLEKESEIAQHQTGHNSGVIHAGIYYAPGSQKAGFCYTGNLELRKYCDERGIDYEMCGKVIVATDETEVPRLHELFARGKANGVKGLELIGRERLREIEPHAAGVKAIWSPETGIIDYRRVSQAYATDFGELGGELRPNTRVEHVARRGNTIHIDTDSDSIAARGVVNCAGLQADLIARDMGERVGLRIVPFRGEYFSLRPEKERLVNGLIYPVPDPKLPFLGVHFTKRIDGSVEAGPNAVLSLKREGYEKSSFDVAEALDIATHPGFWRMSMTHWMTGMKEQYRSLFKSSFVESLQKLMPGDSAGGRMAAQRRRPRPGHRRRRRPPPGLQDRPGRQGRPRPQRPVPRRHLQPPHRPPHRRHRSGCVRAIAFTARWKGKRRSVLKLRENAR